jgi:hypothetical protein
MLIQALQRLLKGRHQGTHLRMCLCFCPQIHGLVPIPHPVSQTKHLSDWKLTTRQLLRLVEPFCWFVTVGELLAQIDHCDGGSDADACMGYVCGST